MAAPVISHFASRKAVQDDGTENVSTDLSFQVTHADKVEADFRALSKYLDTSAESYLSQAWLSSHEPSLEDRVFSYFSNRPFASKVLPRASVSVGFSAMALHWLSTDKK